MSSLVVLHFLHNYTRHTPKCRCTYYWQELINRISTLNHEICGTCQFLLSPHQCSRHAQPGPSRPQAACLLPSSFYFLLRVFCVPGPCSAGQHHFILIRSFSRPWVSLNFDFLGRAIFGYLATRGFFSYRDWSFNIQPLWAS
ncbi:hypothetical protein CY34DRAFT_435150 [Suillus luteus UH-Slu-Lm8-n1]|uniref:Uncharacterized protein n=1 Tax=Suillus luteus UH-Slu-Lm8-n1 TaxID=930992 RepID=A0A0D0B4X8_9AGAM|nr:hypothetical protein CY34DRAFT_435150 [Suillus luteus UH-Slu-Lm8-n1]